MAVCAVTLTSNVNAWQAASESSDSNSDKQHNAVVVMEATQPRLWSEFSDADAVELLKIYPPDRKNVQGAGLVGTLDEVIARLERDPLIAQEIQPSDLPRQFTSTELAAQFFSLRKQIQSVHLALSYEDRNSRDEVPEIRTHFTAAYKGLLQMYGLYNERIPSGKVWNDGRTVWNGTELRKFFTSPSKGFRSADRFSELTSELRDYLLKAALSVGPDVDVRPLSDIGQLLGGDERFLRVDDKLQLVDGHPCHVITAPMGLRMWVEVSGEYCYLRRYVEFHQVGDELSLVLNRVIVNSDFRDTPNGWKWPYKTIECYFEAKNEAGDRIGEYSRSCEYTLKSIEFNTVADDVFELEFPAGTKVLDSFRNVYYIMPEGAELLEDAIKQGAAILPDGTIPDWYRIEQGEHVTPRRVTWSRYLMIGNVVALFCLVILAFLSTKRPVKKETRVATSAAPEQKPNIE